MTNISSNPLASVTTAELAKRAKSHAGLAEQHAESIVKIADEMTRREAEARPAYPGDPLWARFAFSVRFRQEQSDRFSQIYDYLGMRTASGAIYTTGTGESSRFESWEAFMKWALADDKDVKVLHRLAINTSSPALPLTPYRR